MRSGSNASGAQWGAHRAPLALECLDQIEQHFNHRAEDAGDSAAYSSSDQGKLSPAAVPLVGTAGHIA